MVIKVLGAVMIIAAVAGWIFMKNKYGSAGVKGNLICIGLTVVGYFLISG